MARRTTAADYHDSREPHPLSSFSAFSAPPSSAESVQSPPAGPTLRYVLSLPLGLLHCSVVSCFFRCSKGLILARVFAGCLRQSSGTTCSSDEIVRLDSCFLERPSPGFLHCRLLGHLTLFESYHHPLPLFTFIILPNGPRLTLLGNYMHKPSAIVVVCFALNYIFSLKLPYYPASPPHLFHIILSPFVLLSTIV